MATRRGQMLAAGIVAHALQPPARMARASMVTMPTFKPRPLLGRYSVLPVELFRVGPTDKVVLRDYHTQQNRGLTSFDCVLGGDGLVHPSEGDRFISRLSDSSTLANPSNGNYDRTEWSKRTARESLFP